jgi:hypothetical protein
MLNYQRVPTCWAQKFLGAPQGSGGMFLVLSDLEFLHMPSPGEFTAFVVETNGGNTICIDPQQFQGWKPRLNQGFSINNPPISQFKS